MYAGQWGALGRQNLKGGVLYCQTSTSSLLVAEWIKERCICVAGLSSDWAIVIYKVLYILFKKNF